MEDARKSRAQLCTEIAALREELSTVRASATAMQDAGRYRHVLENVRAIMIEADGGGRVTYVSPTVAEILGYLPHEITSIWQSAIHEEDLDALRELYAKITASGESGKTVIRARHRNGDWKRLETTLNTYRDAGGNVRTVALARDVTTEHEAAEALRSSEARYRTLAENASDLITEFDEHGNYLFISPNVHSIIGYTGEQLMEGVLEDGSRIEPDVSEALRRRFIDLPQGDPGPTLYRIRHGDGSWCWLESTGTPRRTADGGVRTVVIGRDVTERVRAHQELLASEERYRRLADVSREWITETDSEGRILYASPNCTELLGLAPEEIVGTTPYLLIHPDDVDRRVEEDLECTRTRQPFSTGPYRIRHRDGSWRWVESRGCTYTGRNGTPMVLRVTRDITPQVEADRERRDLEARMHQTQKLEGLGVMAGGIAHDFNNLLTPILGDTSLALLDLPPESTVRVRLQRVQTAAHRAAALTNQMLTYAGEESLHVEALNLSALVEEIGQLLETAASREAVLVYQLSRDLPLVEGDPARLSQVVMNLITNAAEALDGDDERITIRTGKVELGARDCGWGLIGNELLPGLYVYFEVVDTGHGMDADTRARIFDPFFTTKLTGRGLGLAAVLGIVRAHRGAIGLETAPHRGTTFRVLLPSTDQRLVRSPDTSAAVDNWRGSGTVLIIDDDQGVRDMCADTLARAGFTVICGRDGRDGVELYERHAQEIRAILLDRTMPNTSGEEVFDEIRRIRPDARIILTSGYSQRRAEQRFAGKGLNSFLHKPFLPGLLLQTLRKVLEAPSSRENAPPGAVAREAGRRPGGTLRRSDE